MVPLSKIEEFFSGSYDHPETPIQIEPGTFIIEPQKFVDATIKVLKSQSGKKRFKPYYERLFKFYTVCLNYNKKTSSYQN